MSAGSTWAVVGPLAGVLLGSAITGGFEVWKRAQDRRDRDVERLTEVVLGVLETGTEALLRSDLFVLELLGSTDLVAVMDSKGFRVYNQACARYLAAIARARCIATGTVEAALIEAQDAVAAMSNAARDAAGSIGTPTHLEKLKLVSAGLEAARTTQNDFVVEAVKYLRDL